MSLAKLTETFTTKKMRLSLPCVCGKDCGGYCAIKRTGMDTTHWCRLKTYLEADCKSLYGALAALSTFAAVNNLDLGLTLGSSALRNASRFGLAQNRLELSQWRFARLGYHGGRTQIFQSRAERLTSADIRSSYPYQLRARDLPSGVPVWAKDWRGKAAIVHASVTVPVSFCPPLPARAKERVAYPVGTFAGIWPSPELERAVSLGAKIERVHKALVWPETSRPLAPWIDKIFALRAKALRVNKTLATWLKLYANSLYGKLGAREEHETVFLNPAKIAFCNSRAKCKRFRGDCGECCHLHCSGACGSHLEIAPGVFTKSIARIEPTSRPEIAAFVTAYGRMQLGDALNIAVGPIYCDTDSVFSLGPLPYAKPDAEAGLGDFVDEGEAFEFEAFAPKVYRYRRPDGWKVRSKGFQAEQSALRADAVFETWGIEGFRTGVKHELFTKAKRKRTLNVGLGDRVRVDNNLSRAPVAGVDIALELER